MKIFIVTTVPDEYQVEAQAFDSKDKVVKLVEKLYNEWENEIISRDKSWWKGAPEEFEPNKQIALKEVKEKRDAALSKLHSFVDGYEDLGFYQVHLVELQ